MSFISAMILYFAGSTVPIFNDETLSTKSPSWICGYFTYNLLNAAYVWFFMWIIPLLTIEILVEDFNYHCQHVESESVCHHFPSFIRWFQKLEESFKYYCFTYYTTNQVFIIFNMFANLSSFLDQTSITMSVCLDFVGITCINICVVLMLISLTDSIDSAYQTVLKQKEKLQDRFLGGVKNIRLLNTKQLKGSV